MRRLISRQRPSSLSRRPSYIGSVPDHARAGRGLGHFVSSVAHGVTDFSHDLGKGAAKAFQKAVEVLESVVSRAGAGGSSGHDSGSGTAPGTETRQVPPTPDPVSGSASQPTSSSVGQQDPSTSHSSEYTTVSPTPGPSTSASQNDGASNAESHHSSGPSLQDALYPSSLSSLQYGETGNGVTLAPSSTASTIQSSTTTDTLPSSGGGGTAHRKGFPPAATAAIGSVLGFLVVSALFWAVWLYLRRRRRALHAVYLPPKRMLSITSTVPLFIGASEAGVKEDSKNPFGHSLDADEDDPFDAASLWRSSKTRSESTLSV